MDTMNEFTHEELQQVIRKYDSEYKRIKKQVIEVNARGQELEERAAKAEKDNSMLRD